MDIQHLWLPAQEKNNYQIVKYQWVIKKIWGHDDGEDVGRWGRCRKSWRRAWVAKVIEILCIHV